MQNFMEKLSQKKFLLVTGKGGSGKSLLSLAMAHRFSQLGKRVLLVELGRRRDKAFTRLPELLGLATLSHKSTSVLLPESRLQIQAAILNPTQSLAEYVDLKLPTGGLAGILLNNKVTASFLEVVPGLPDLVSLGKLWFSVTHPDPKLGPDMVIFDAPASGHACTLLQAPSNFERITRVGPIHKDAAAMSHFFADPENFGLVFTTLPEEMSLQETSELKQKLKNFPAPFVFVNRCFPPLPPLDSNEKSSILLKAYSYSAKRAAREKEALENWSGNEPLSSNGFTQNIPFFFPDPQAPLLFLRISEALR